MHEVQRNVPVPKPTKPTAPVRRKYPFEEMSVGDMFFVPGKTKNTLTTHTSTVGKKLGRKFITRLTHMVETLDGWKQAGPDDENAIQGVGVWRIE
jgi:hypothetical protein